MPRLLALLATVCVPLLSLTAAEPFRESFDGRFTSWQPATNSPDVQVASHVRRPEAGREGGGEELRIESRREAIPATWEHALPPAKVLDELTASVSVQSDHPGWVLAVRIIVSGVIDPETGKPVELVLPGEVYRDAGQWQTLKCRTSDKEIRQRIVLLRARFPGVTDVGEIYVDRAILACHMPLGRSSLMIDDLQLVPVVTPKAAVTATEGVQSASTEPPVTFQLDRLQVAERPFFPRMVRYHGEPPEVLKRA
ncbi:MAG: hypothetical protein SH850_19305, partial [Planctomycetaceae bacterium]|nr:hypothetical protein [Planctomycetaceae bacterium]